MHKFSKLLPHLLVYVFIFYLLPLGIQNTSSAMIILLIGIPVLSFVAAIVFGMKFSFQWIYPSLVILLFLPSLFIFYNYTAWPYIFIYGFIAAVGCLIGKQFYKRRQ